MNPADDPKPQAPVEPDPSECCGSGCLRCVFDIHAEAMQRHREATSAWEERQRADPACSGDSEGQSATREYLTLESAVAPAHRESATH